MSLITVRARPTFCGVPLRKEWERWILRALEHHLHCAFIEFCYVPLKVSGKVHLSPRNHTSGVTWPKSLFKTATLAAILRVLLSVHDPQKCLPLLTNFPLRPVIVGRGVVLVVVLDGCSSAWDGRGGDSYWHGRAVNSWGYGSQGSSIDRSGGGGANRNTGRQSIGRWTGRFLSTLRQRNTCRKSCVGCLSDSLGIIRTDNTSY